jgi:hypothetical protein
MRVKAPASPGKVRASVLVLTGANDPLAPPDHVAALENEMRAAGTHDWQVITYGNTHHAFTNPAADGSFLSGTLYNEKSDRRSWAAMTSFLEEVLYRHTVISRTDQSGRCPLIGTNRSAPAEDETGALDPKRTSAAAIPIQATFLLFTIFVSTVSEARFGPAWIIPSSLTKSSDRGSMARRSKSACNSGRRPSPHRAAIE